jgi:hypothetical protein
VEEESWARLDLGLEVLAGRLEDLLGFQVGGEVRIVRRQGQLLGCLPCISSE